MAKKKKKSDQFERKEAFKSLPDNIKSTLSEEEVDAFLNKDVWPEELFEKLKDFIVPSDD